MNRFVKNKKRAKALIHKLGHKVRFFYIFSGFALARCVKCGAMTYVAGKHHRHLYNKEISGDAIRKSCALIR